MRVVGAEAAAVTGVEKLPGVSHYLSGRDPAKWRTNVPHYAKVRYEGVYPGIDLLYYGNQRQLEYDFVVSPGADPGRIRLRFEGAESLRLEPGGDLVFRLKDGEVRQSRPVVYQEESGRRRPVEGAAFEVRGREVAFRIPEYDRTTPLVIDPVIGYST